MIRSATFAVLVVLISPRLQWADDAAEKGVKKGAPIRIAVYSDKGAGRSLKSLLAVLAKDPALKATKVSAAEIREKGLSAFDVVIHPGGSGGKQGRTLMKAGRKRVRDFVRDGGGYVGFCAGAYLATNDYKWSLHILDAKVLDRKHWARGFGTVQLRLTEAGRRMLGREKASLSIYYHQGPLLAPNNDPRTPDYRPLAVFQSEVKKKGGPGGVMIGTTAICSGRYGRGRVFCFSPHPEKTKGLAPLVHRAVHWAANRGRMKDR